MKPKPLWTPSERRIAEAAMSEFWQLAENHTGRTFADYRALHAWSAQNPADFWKLYADYAGFDLNQQVMSDDPMPYTKWFEGTTLNYAQALLYPTELKGENALAIVAANEAGDERRFTYAELRREVARCAAALKRTGVAEGDRIAASVSNTPEAVILLLACASIGAVFSSCSPDFGADAAADRFGQIEPKLLVASGGYHYNGKLYSTVETVQKLSERIESLLDTVVIPSDTGSGTFTSWQDWLGDEDAELDFAQLPFDHPLYILYSSGTTGLPKAIVHRSGGALLSHHKEHRLHADIKLGDVVFYFTTCGWMMWNWLVSVLTQGATIVLYDGSPSYPSLEITWQLAEKLRMTYFGTSARFIHSCKDFSIIPKELADLRALKSISSTGSPLSPAGFRWVYEAVKEDVHLASISGGTDIVSCFMLGNPVQSVYEGTIQAAGMGVALAAYDDKGEPVTGEPGELVCEQPLPSMPLTFWNDPGFERYKGAYLDYYPGVWRHGDLIEVTDEGIVVYGRSDATLNPGGVRIGTAEIYRPLQALSEVMEALAVGKKEDGDEVIWLFVVLREDVTLDEDLTKRIKGAIRQDSSPRHTPKRVFQVSQLPRTRSGKLVEVAVSRMVNGHSVPNRQAMENPEALEAIARVLEEQASEQI